MKRILYILFIFFILADVDNAAAFYNCIDSEGNPIITDNPPPGARCGAPGEKIDAVAGEKNSECSRIIESLNSYDSMSTLTTSQRENQTELIEKLKSCDNTDNVLRRVNNILSVLQSKSTLTPSEQEQKKRMLRLKAELSSTKENEYVESEQAQRKAKYSDQKAEMKRLLRITRPSY